MRLRKSRKNQISEKGIPTAIKLVSLECVDARRSKEALNGGKMGGIYRTAVNIPARVAKSKRSRAIRHLEKKRAASVRGGREPLR